MTDLRNIPGVGKATEQDLLSLGYDCMASLVGADPEEMYARTVEKDGPTDICQLYVYRCAVYFCNTKNPEPEKCKWWYWKDHKLEV